jgi:hypothetical protein
VSRGCLVLLDGARGKPTQPGGLPEKAKEVGEPRLQAGEAASPIRAVVRPDEFHTVLQREPVRLDVDRDLQRNLPLLLLEDDHGFRMRGGPR